MVFPGHIAAGYLVAYGVIHAAGIPLTGNEQTLMLAVGALLGDGPDSDIFLSFLKKGTTKPGALVGHRDHITYTPILWLAIGAIVYAFSGTSPIGQVLGVLLWLCPWSHLLMDSLYTNTGIRWLWPITDKRYYLLKREDSHFSNWKDLLLGYLKNPLFYVEMLVTLAALVLLISQLI